MTQIVGLNPDLKWESWCLFSILTPSHHDKTPILCVVNQCSMVGLIFCPIESFSEKKILLSQIEALEEGLLTEAEIRNNIRPMINTRMKLGKTKFM